MSHVRLSNGSPTLERMEAAAAASAARQADYPPKPSACRNLFGPVDHDELARELRRHRRALDEASRRKWNFDFHRERPLDGGGRYEWQALGHDALPDFYSRPPRLGPAAMAPAGQKRPPRDALPPAAASTTTAAAAAAFRRSQGISEEGGGGDQDSDGAAAEPGDDCAAGQRKRPASDEPTRQKRRCQKALPVPAQWNKHPRNLAQGCIERKLCVRMKNFCFLFLWRHRVHEARKMQNISLILHGMENSYKH